MPSLCITGLLLLLAAHSHAAAVGLATPVEYEYHSYAVTPLSPHTYSAPAADDVPHAQEDVAASSSALHVRLVHRDSFAVNATPAQLLARRLQRDELRAAWIIWKAAANGTPVVGLSSGRGLVGAVGSWRRWGVHRQDRGGHAGHRGAAGADTDMASRGCDVPCVVLSRSRARVRPAVLRRDS
ncbi:unnamed protein product [Miscanthus lutarioriparius]|uniref:Uncharacterized protein n=1 Tax=Miscanthus lutarioriparius TaxID=422564 RepID=A0A811PBQ4_9POAL|nr:unnamed protein product [Miscanthus lutarioriparius]